MVYFAYGALGLIDVTRDFWIKEKLTLTPSELAGIGVWLTLPWTVKMVFGELVDCVPILGLAAAGLYPDRRVVHRRPGWSRSRAPPAAGSPSCRRTSSMCSARC